MTYTYCCPKCQVKFTPRCQACAEKAPVVRCPNCGQAAEKKVA